MLTNKQIYVFISSFFLLLSFVACKTLKLEDIDKKFADGKYFAAAEDYRTLYRQTSPKRKTLRAEIALKVGESYRLSNNPIRASVGYANALRYNVDDSTIELQYARTLQKLGKYKEAIKHYEEFLKKYPDNLFAKNGLEGCKVAPDWIAHPTRDKIQRMTLFDFTKGSSFAPALLPPNYEQVYFTGNGGKEIIGDTISSITGQKNNDIFMSRQDENGKWMKPEHVESAINTYGDEGVVSFNKLGDAMYYTYAPVDSIRTFPASIYVSLRAGGAWNAGERIEIVKGDTINVFAHPAIDASEEYLYFVTDIKGGYGGKDIWRAKMHGNIVDYIENLGPEINTAGDEMFPYMFNDSVMYFSSDGHIGMGGLDIYRAEYDKKTTKWRVENLRYPINSSADDFGITFDAEGIEGFFSSNRGDAKGYDHIYAFINKDVITALEGYIVDTDDEFIEKATIRMVGKDGANSKFPGKVDGTYRVDVAQGVDYVLLASAPDHLNARMAVSTIKQEADSIYPIDFVLTPINKPVVLENIFFEFDKATLLPESKTGLDELIALLNDNPNVTIELSSHTDRKGSQEYNQGLSQRRADAVMNYLIKEGHISADRLTSVGKGKLEPKKITKAIRKKYDFLIDGEELTPEFIEQFEKADQDLLDQINRRTEFKVSSITYGLE